MQAQIGSVIEKLLKCIILYPEFSNET